MTIEEKIERIKLLSNNSLDGEYSDEVLTAFLESARDEILNWAYTKDRPDEVPTKWENIQCFSVIAGINQIGAEGSNNYSANGMGRGFVYSTMVQFIHSHIPVGVVIV